MEHRIVMVVTIVVYGGNLENNISKAVFNSNIRRELL
jgi:hypothetical protein